MAFIYCNSFGQGQHSLQTMNVFAQQKFRTVMYTYVHLKHP